MKQSMMSLALLSVFVCLACKDGGETFQLPANVYSVEKIYDVGNSGSASDFRIYVNFNSAVNIDDLEEVRLVIVKSSDDFSTDQIDALVGGNYFPMTISNAASQVIKPGADIKDSDGDPIANNTSYSLYIATIGQSNSHQLSEAKLFTLQDKPVYAGDYVGTWEDLGPPGPAKFGMSLRISENYTGQMFYADTTFMPFGNGAQDATITMTVSGTEITSFVLNQFISGYNGGCAAQKTLTGHFEDDINLVLDTFNWADCDGTRDVKLLFRKK
ncbi:hypothetical protein K1X84_09640 [bacterium]|nr:hypothetical protein [bacterium]